MAEPKFKKGDRVLVSHKIGEEAGVVCVDALVSLSKEIGQEHHFYFVRTRRKDINCRNHWPGHRCGTEHDYRDLHGEGALQIDPDPPFLGCD